MVNESQVVSHITIPSDLLPHEIFHLAQQPGIKDVNLDVPTYLMGNLSMLDFMTIVLSECHSLRIVQSLSDGNEIVHEFSRQEVGNTPFKRKGGEAVGNNFAQ